VQWGPPGWRCSDWIIYLCLTGSEASYRRHCYCRDPQARPPPSGLGRACVLGRSRALGHARALLAGVEARATAWPDVCCLNDDLRRTCCVCDYNVSEPGMIAIQPSIVLLSTDYCCWKRGILGEPGYDCVPAYPVNANSPLSGSKTALLPYTYRRCT